jgi:hypothetical protein
MRSGELVMPEISAYYNAVASQPYTLDVLF